MDRKKAKQVKLIVGVSIIILMLAISANAIGDFLDPMKLVSEVTSRPEDYLNRNIQVIGFIVEGTWQKTGPNTYTFRLTDGNATIDVEYTGDVPGTIKPDVGVTVIGTLVSPDKVVANK
ncbi:MAG: cytochrome c maturation protein CcmE, partial [Candidatus Hydrothermarchaeales archaeon]